MNQYDYRAIARSLDRLQWQAYIDRLLAKPVGQPLRSLKLHKRILLASESPKYSSATDK